MEAGMFVFVLVYTCSLQFRLSGKVNDRTVKLVQDVYQPVYMIASLETVSVSTAQTHDSFYVLTQMEYHDGFSSSESGTGVDLYHALKQSLHRSLVSLSRNTPPTQ